MFASLPSVQLPQLSPAPLFILVRKVEPLVPFSVKKSVIETALNKAFRQPLADDEFYFLEDQTLGLDVQDLGIKVSFRCLGEQLIVCEDAVADAWIRGDAVAFMRLANRDQDPDTLFFQRKLLIEGDTELGLAVKNLLDSIDWSELPAVFQKGMGLMAKITPSS